MTPITDLVRPRLNTLIEDAFRLYEVEQQKVIFAINRDSYRRAFYNYFLEVFNRLGDAKFLDSFYDPTTRLYAEVNSSEVFVSEIIKKFLDVLDKETLIVYRMMYDGYKNSFDLIVNYSLNLLKNTLNLVRIDSSNLLRLIDHYDKHIYDSAPTVVYLKRPSTRINSTSRFLKRRFFDTHKDKVYKLATSVISNIEKINRALSDSAEYKEENIFKKPLTEGVLRRSWGGDGDSIYRSCAELHALSKYFGRTEDSKAFEIEFVERYLNLLKSCSFGTNSGAAEFIIGNENLFGKFNELYTVGESDSKEIYGLSFLSSLTKTRTFQSISPGVDPIRAMFANGIKDRLDSPKLGKSTNRKLVPISVYVSNALRKARNIGWNALSIHNSLDDNDRLPGYEGLGSLKYPVEALRQIFPTKFKSVPTGLTGALDSLARFISDAETHLEEGAMPSQTLEQMVPWLNLIKNKIETVVSTIETVGYKSGDIIPNIPINITSRTRQDYSAYFKRSGYTNQEIEKILESRNLRDLVENFSDKMSYADVRSFVDCYDLCALTYSIGGENGVQEVLNYLIEPNSQGFARLYEFLEKKQSKFIKLNSYKYGKLVGALYSVLRLTNNDAITDLKNVLRGKNSTVGESLKIVSELGLTDPLKDAAITDLITPLIDQSADGAIRGTSLADTTYEQALKDAPYSLREWSGLIQNSAGFALQQDLIELLNSRAGVTYDELISLLRLDNNPGLSVLSGILDGARGSEFTRIARDFYLSGLALVSRDTHSSARSGNSIVGELDFFIVDLINNLKSLVIDLDLISYRLLTATELGRRSFGVADRSRSALSESIINSTNKPLETLSHLIETLRLDSNRELPYLYNKTYLRNILDESGLAEPPGIGNSPRIPRRFKPNTITPELASLLTPQSTTTQVSSRYRPRAQKYIKISGSQFNWKEPAELAENLDKTQALSADPYNNSVSETDTFIIDTARPLLTTFVSSTPAPITNSLVESIIDASLSSPVTGSYFIEYPIEKTPIREYDPIEECVQFGTSRSKCQELFKDYERVDCPEYAYNRSSLIEDNEIFSESIAVDRPLGVGAGPNPSGMFIQNHYKELPMGFENLPRELVDGIDENGEVFGNFVIDDLDIVHANNTSALNSYKSKYGFPLDERDCSRRNSSSELQKCMTLLMCARTPEKDRPKPCSGLFS